MRNIIFVLSVFIAIGWGCGGSSPVSQSKESLRPDVISLIPSDSTSDLPAVKPLPPPPLLPSSPTAYQEEKGIVKLYMKAYDPCKKQGCDEEKKKETEEDRQRFSVPYHGDGK